MYDENYNIQNEPLYWINISLTLINSINGEVGTS